MRICEARYGLAGGAAIDVTAPLQRMLVNGVLCIPIVLDLNLLFGDPAPGVPKHLTITYEDGAHGPRTVSVPEYDGFLAKHLELGTAFRTPWPVPGARRRIACLYAHYEKNAAYRDNLAFFLRHGISDWIDYVIVINGECSLELPVAPNITVIRRPNSGFDFGAHGAGLRALTGQYDYYVFLNSTCRGPFLPPYVHMHWTEPFTALATGKVELVGASIAVQYNLYWISYFTSRFGWRRQYYPAVESYFFLLTHRGLEIAREAGIFAEPDETDYWDVVFKREIALSLCLLSRGYGIDCLIPEMRGVDYRSCVANFNPSHFTPTRPGGCFGRSLHPYEVIFIKQNRQISDHEVDSLTRYLDRPLRDTAG